MHPAFSVIAFTTLSGAGYGMLIWLGLHTLGAASAFPPARALTLLAVALVLVSGGLMASTLHLGHPERAWRAFSQWRSSWLSREGVAALLTYLPALALGCLWWRGDSPVALRTAGALTLAFSVLTLYCTTRIYSSLKTIPAWHNGWLWPVFLVLALWSGALLSTLVSALAGAVPPLRMLAGSALLTLLAVALKWAYWLALARMPDLATTGSATGLDKFGKVRPFEAPHTEANYLQQEMGFRLARKHATLLQRAFTALAGAVLAALLLTALAPGIAWLGASLAVVAAGLALAIERWLLFAQARHVVMSYYEQGPAAS